LLIEAALILTGDLREVWVGPRMVNRPYTRRSPANARCCRDTRVPFAVCDLEMPRSQGAPCRDQDRAEIAQKTRSYSTNLTGDRARATRQRWPSDRRAIPNKIAATGFHVDSSPRFFLQFRELRFQQRDDSVDDTL